MPRQLDPEKRTRILEAARAIFLELGYANARITDIATKAGLGVGTLYLYFDSKESIARALADNFYRRVETIIAPEIESAIASHTTPEQFRNIIHQAFNIAVEERDFLLLPPSVIEPSNSSPHNAHSTFLKQLGTALAALMAAGRIRHYEDPYILAELIVSLSQPVIRTYLTLNAVDRERYESLFTDFLESALTHSLTLEDQSPIPTVLPHHPTAHAANQ